LQAFAATRGSVETGHCSGLLRIARLNKISGQPKLPAITSGPILEPGFSLG
jgi:hypothetical protein